jgi:UDP-glucose 4-epimerase
VVVDFIRKLKRDPAYLEILGDGKQAKPYLHVSECVAGMVWGYENAHDSLNYFNLSCQDATSVDRIAGIVMEVMGIKGTKYLYTGGRRGWPGDVPCVRLNPAKLASLGWTTLLTSDEAVKKAVQELLEQLG